MKLAYLILAHKNPEQLAFLLRQIQHQKIGLFLHIDKCSDIHAFNEALIRHKVSAEYVSQRVHIIYSSIRYVYATLDLMRKAYDANYDYYCLISGQDLPLKSPEEILTFFEANQNKNYFNYQAFPISSLPYGGSTRHEYYNFLIRGKMETLFPWGKIQHNISPKGRILNLLLGIRNGFRFKRSYPLSFQPYYSSQWWNINRKAVSYLLKFLDDYPEFLKFHKNSLHPEEMLFQTAILNNHDLYRTVVNDNLRHIEWKAGKKHPELLNVDNLDSIRNKTDAIFARKFSLNKGDKSLI